MGNVSYCQNPSLRNSRFLFSSSFHHVKFKFYATRSVSSLVRLPFQPYFLWRLYNFSNCLPDGFPFTLGIFLKSLVSCKGIPALSHSGLNRIEIARKGMVFDGRLAKEVLQSGRPSVKLNYSDVRELKITSKGRSFKPRFSKFSFDPPLFISCQLGSRKYSIVIHFINRCKCTRPCKSVFDDLLKAFT